MDEPKATPTPQPEKPKLYLPKTHAEWMTLLGIVGLGVYHASVKDMDGLMATLVAAAGLYGLNSKQGQHGKTLKVLAELVEQSREHLEDIRNNPAMPGTPTAPSLPETKP